MGEASRGGSCSAKRGGGRRGGSIFNGANNNIGHKPPSSSITSPTHRQILDVTMVMAMADSAATMEGFKVTVMVMELVIFINQPGTKLGNAQRL